MPTSISDNVGSDGRAKSNYADNAILYSVNYGKLANGLSSWAVEADYLIIMALLKRHIRQGVILWRKTITKLPAFIMTDAKIHIAISILTGKGNLST